MGTRRYDVAAHWQRFIVIVVTPAKETGECPPSIRVVQSWYEEFRNREQD